MGSISEKGLDARATGQILNANISIFELLCCALERLQE